MLVLRSRFKLCVDQHPGYILHNVGQSSVRHPTLVICVVLRCRGRSSETEVGPFSGPPKVGYQNTLAGILTDLKNISTLYAGNVGVEHTSSKSH